METTSVYAKWTFIISLLSLSIGWPTIAVDTHIYRVSNRTKLAMGKTVEKVEEKLLKVIPAEFKVDVHHWLILHGRYTCVAKNRDAVLALLKTCVTLKIKLKLNTI